MSSGRDLLRPVRHLSVQGLVGSLVKCELLLRNYRCLNRVLQPTESPPVLHSTGSLLTPFLRFPVSQVEPTSTFTPTNRSTTSQSGIDGDLPQSPIPPFVFHPHGVHRLQGQKQVTGDGVGFSFPTRPGLPRQRHSSPRLDREDRRLWRLQETDRTREPESLTQNGLDPSDSLLPSLRPSLERQVFQLPERYHGLHSHRSDPVQDPRCFMQCQSLRLDEVEQVPPGGSPHPPFGRSVFGIRVPVRDRLL